MQDFGGNAKPGDNRLTEVAAWIEDHGPVGSERPPPHELIIAGKLQLTKERADDLGKNTLPEDDLLAGDPVGLGLGFLDNVAAIRDKAPGAKRVLDSITFPRDPVGAPQQTPRHARLEKGIDQPNLLKIEETKRDLIVDGHQFTLPQMALHFLGDVLGRKSLEPISDSSRGDTAQPRGIRHRIDTLA